MPTASDMSLTGDQSTDQQFSKVLAEGTAESLQETLRDAYIINDYGEAVQPVDFVADNCVEALAYVSRRNWCESSEYTEQESRVWQLLHFLQSKPPIKKVCEFFWGQVNISQITNEEGDLVFWNLATSRRQDAANLCQNLERWDLKSLIECQDDALVRAHCKNVLSADVGFPLWEVGIYSLLCGDFEHALPLCSDWEQELSVRLTCSLMHGLETYSQVGEIMSLLTNSTNIDTVNACEQPYYQTITNIMLGKVTEFLENDAQQILSTDRKPRTNQSYLTNIRLDAHLAIIYGVTPATEPLVHAYIEILLLANCAQIIPSYVRFLDKGLQSSVYGTILGRLDQSAEEQSIQLAFAQRYKIDIEAAVLDLVDACFNSYNAASLTHKNLSDLDPAGEEEHKMISALTWLSLLQKWDQLAAASKQLLDIWLPRYQIGAALELNRELSLGRIVSVSHQDDPNSSLMIELGAHHSILAFLSAILDKRKGHSLVVRLDQVDQYLGVGLVSPEVRKFYVYYCYDQTLKYLNASKDAGALLLDLATHISSRPGVLELLNSNKFLQDLMRDISADITVHPEHI